MVVFGAISSYGCCQSGNLLVAPNPARQAGSGRLETAGESGGAVIPIRQWRGGPDWWGYITLGEHTLPLDGQYISPGECGWGVPSVWAMGGKDRK